MSRHILIAEDEPDLAAIVADYLRAEGWTAELAGDGASALDRALSGSIDLLVLDIMLPALDGLSVCRAIRSSDARDLPVIMVTAQVQEIDRLLGLDAGADDYLCKPFSPRELIARIKAVLRRTRPDARSKQADARALVLDPDSHAASLHGKPLALTRTEFALLTRMARRPGAILSRALLLDAIGEDQLDISDRAIDTHIKNLRRKLAEAAPDLAPIRSVYGVGYSLEI